MSAARALFLATALAAAPAAAQVTLKASSWVPEQHPLAGEMLAALCTDFAAATAGRVKCERLARAPVAPPQTFEAVRDGLADLSFIVHGYTPGRFALGEAPELPFMGDTAEATAVAYQRVFDRMLARAGEHKGVVVLAVFTHGPGQVFNSKRPVRALEDFKGLRIRVGGGMTSELAQRLGAVPMLRPATEAPALLKSGAADGVFLPKESPASFGLLPLLRHATYVPGGLYNTSFAWIANPAKWAAIAPEDRARLAPLLGEELARRSGRMWDAADARGEAAVRAAGIPVLVAGPALLAEIRKRAAGLEKAWVDKVKSKGVDGAAVLAALRAEVSGLSRK
jgi:TRAP-type C4-dicarboxylate transport system substrate-binding protein